MALKIITNSEDLSPAEGKFIYLDNDFLGAVYRDAELFRETLKLFPKSFLTLDPFTRFEFLREMYLPSELSLKTSFIDKDEVFFPQPLQQERLKQTQTNALILSQIYSHQNQNKKLNGKTTWSTVDLLLAGSLMLSDKSSLLITGNTKDFPHVFNVVGIVNVVRPDNTIIAYSILQFNREKFDDCRVALNSINP